MRFWGFLPSYVFVSYWNYVITLVYMRWFHIHISNFIWQLSNFWCVKVYSSVISCLYGEQQKSDLIFFLFCQNIYIHCSRFFSSKVFLKYPFWFIFLLILFKPITFSFLTMSSQQRLSRSTIFLLSLHFAILVSIFWRIF